MKLYYIRHGNPSYNPDCLTIRGHFEAECTANVLKQFGIKKIISSDAGRAFETASHLAKKINLEIEKLECLNESLAAKYYANMEDGINTWIFWSKKYHNLLVKHEQNDNWKTDKDFEQLNVSNGINIINKNVDDILMSLNIKHDRKNKTYEAVGKYPDAVAVFAHGGMGMSFVPSILDENFLHFCLYNCCLDTCGVCEFDIDLEKTHKIQLVRYNQIYYDLAEASKLPMRVE